MNDIKIEALVNPFSKRIEYREWDSEEYHCSFGHGEDNVTLEHTEERRFGAALVYDGEDGPCIHVSPTIPVPPELASEIIGYSARTKVPFKRAPYGRYELRTAVGFVSEDTYNRNEKIAVNVQGENREDVMTLLSAIVAGNQKPVVLWDGSAPKDVAATATPVESPTAAMASEVDHSANEGREDPMAAVRAMSGGHTRY